MGLPTRNIRTNDENRALRAKFIENATSLLTKYAIPIETFVPKAIFEDNGEKYIKVYPTEASKGLDLYIELVTMNYEPVLSETGAREIRKWKYNPHYKDEYKNQVLMTVDVYLIPIAELLIITNETGSIPAKTENLQTKNIQTLSTVKGRSLTSDAKFSDMTLRDFFAILHKKPVSSKPWLNNLIEENP